MSTPHRPNLLFVLTDDQAAWAMGAYGNTDLHTPHMDRIAREGVCFMQAFTAPVCSPSRAMILMGRYPHQVGISDWIAPHERVGVGPETPLVSEVLRGAGYVAGLIGKWHLGKEPPFHPLRRGFDEFTGFLGGGCQPLNPTLVIDGEERQVEGFLIDWITERAVQFLRRHRERPFALFFHTREPHKPYTPVPEEDMAHYLGRRLRVPTVTNIPDEQMQEEHRYYYASISSIDRNLGRLLAELETLGLLDQTLVVVMGDNGYMIGQHGLETKGNAWVFDHHQQRRPNMFDDSIRVPLVARWPCRIPPGSVCEEMVCALDLFPTLLELLREAGVGVDPPSRSHRLLLEGQSLLPLLGSQQVPWRDALFLLYDMHHGASARMRMVRTREWKLVWHHEKGGVHELYHLADDPGEERNRYGDDSVASVREELMGGLYAWQRQVGDPLAEA